MQQRSVIHDSLFKIDMLQIQIWFKLYSMQPFLFLLLRVSETTYYWCLPSALSWRGPCAPRFLKFSYSQQEQQMAAAAGRRPLPHKLLLGQPCCEAVDLCHSGNEWTNDCLPHKCEKEGRPCSSSAWMKTPSNELLTKAGPLRVAVFLDHPVCRCWLYQHPLNIIVQKIGWGLYKGNYHPNL